MDGIRFLFTSFVLNFADFSVVAVIFVSMMGIGVAEQAGHDGGTDPQAGQGCAAAADYLHHHLVGVLSSVATDAGYLILIPLGAPPS